MRLDQVSRLKVYFLKPHNLMFNWLNNRSLKEEIMDDFSCEGEVVDQTLKELHHINFYLGGDQISINGLKFLINKDPKQEYKIVDLGCGGGDTLKIFDKWAKKNNFHFDLVGVDANEYIINYAQKNCIKNSNISFLSGNVLSDNFKNKKFDIAHASLFLHHFQDEEIVNLFKQLLDQVEIGIVINDLHRHWISYFFTKYFIATWSKSAMVKYDSILSVERSFIRKELEAYLKMADIRNYSLRWKWAFRWELIIWK